MEGVRDKEKLEANAQGVIPFPPPHTRARADWQTELDRDTGLILCVRLLLRVGV